MNQGRSGSVGRFPGLLRHGTIRGGALEAQGEGLKILLTLVEGIGRPPDGNRCPVCIPAIISATCDFASYGTVKY